MRRLFPPLMVFFCLLTSLLADSGTLWSGLTPQQQEQLSSGEPVVLEQDVPDNPWPRFTVYHLVKSSAENVAAVFWDCELDPKYVPNCLSVTVTLRPLPCVHEGEYTLKMPFFLPNEVYVSRNELTLPSPGVYEISWKVLQARYFTASTGNLRIEPHGEKGEKSLLRYVNLVTPGSQIAGLLRTKARTQVVESVNALVRQVEGELADSPQLLQRQLEDLKKSLPKSQPPPLPGGS